MAVTYAQMRDAIFDAVDTQDDEKLNILVERFNPIYKMHKVALSCYASKGDLAVVKKLLELPCLDQASDIYTHAVSSTYAEIAGNRGDDRVPPGVLELLYEKIKDNDAAKTSALSFIFNCIVSSTADRISIKGARMLADTDAACDKGAEQTENRLKADIVIARRELKKLTDLKKAVKSSPRK